MNKILKYVISILLFIGILASFSSRVFASSFNFSVTPEQSDKQIDKEKSYFDLLLSPGTSTELNVILRNDTEKEIKVGISINSAKTNSNGIVEYSNNSKKIDQSLEYNIEDYVKYPRSVTIEPNDNTLVTIKVTMPNQKFDGVLANGITFQEINDDRDSKSNKNEGLAISNEYSYIVALLLRQTDRKVNPNMNLNDISPGHVNNRNVIFMDLQNDQKTYINKTFIIAAISKKGDKEVLYKLKKDNLQIAPNSNFLLPISLEGNSLKPGDYHLSMKIYGNRDEHGVYTMDSKSGDATFLNLWSFEKDFKIDDNTAKKLNSSDVSLNENNLNEYFYLKIIFWVLIFLIVILIIVLKMNTNKKNKL